MEGALNHQDDSGCFTDMLFNMSFHISGIGKDTKTIKNQGGSKTIGLSYLSWCFRRLFIEMSCQT